MHSELKAFLIQIKPHWVWSFVSVLTGLAGMVAEMAGVMLISPLLTQGQANPVSRVPLVGPAVDALLRLPKEEIVVWVACLLIVVAILRGLLGVLVKVALELQRANIERDLRFRVLDQLLTIQPHHLEREKVGHLGNIMLSDVSVAGAIADRLTISLTAALQFAVLLATMLLISVQLTAVALGLLGIVFWLTRVYLVRRLDALGLSATNAMTRTGQSLFDIASNIRSIHLLGINREIRQRAAVDVSEYASSQKWRLIGLGLVSPLFTAAIGVVIGLLLLGAGMGGKGVEAQIAGVLILLVIITRLSAPATSITETLGYMAAHSQQLRQLMQFLDKSDKPYVDEGRVVAQVPQRAIVFERVSYGYEGRGPGIRQVDLTIPMGGMVAFAGPSGSGKSTLISLLVRLFDPVEGRILADGTDIKSYQIETWRRNLAVVSQDNIILNGTVADNLRLAAPNAAPPQLWDALEKAGAAAFVRELPGGLEAMLGDRAMNLSGGQRQRLSIARALLSDRRILVLDEATSQVDSETEHVIQGAIERLRGSHTIILIAHRVSNIVSADVIYLLSEGRIVGHGTHDELMRNSDLYHRLVSLQSIGGGTTEMNGGV